MFKLSLLLSLLALFFTWNCQNSSPSKIKAVQGVFDFKKSEGFTNPEKFESVKLDGDWEFYPYEFLDTSAKDLSGKKPIYLAVPGVWNNVFNGGYGYGTFRLIVILPESLKKPFVFKIPEQGTAYAMYVNGALIASNGQVGKTMETSIPQYRPLITSTIIPERQIEIILHISNFHHRQGGLWYSILIGYEDTIREIRERNLLLDFFLLGSILIMGIYHITLFTLRRKDKSPLLFALFCFVIILRLLSFNEKYLSHIFPDIPFALSSKIEYLSYYMAVPLMSNFLYSIFPDEFNEKILKLIWIVSLLFSGLVAVTDIRTYSQTATIFHSFTLCSLSYFIYVIILSILNKRDGGKTILVGMFLIIFGTANDILFSMEIIHTEYIIPQSLLGFILSQSIILSIRFSKAFHQVENLTKNLSELNNELEAKVIMRTAELNSAMSVIKKDLLVSQNIQSKIFPENIQIINGLLIYNRYIPMIEVGGDFYDILSLSDSVTRVLIADATGHGVQGALITMLIRSEYKLLGPTTANPALLLEKVNNIFFKNYSNLGILFTCFIIDIDTNTGELQYASGGHPEQILVSDSEMTLLKGRGRMIGLVPESIYELRKSSFRKSDKLFLFTDGIFEEFNRRQEVFSEERLYKILNSNWSNPLKQIVENTLAELTEFMDGGKMNDDITFMGIERLGDN